MKEPILELDDVRVRYTVEGAQGGLARAVDGVTLEVEKGEILGLVGESGCGKTTLARAILGMQPLAEGAVRFEGKNLARLSKKELQALRPDIQMIFQDPYASLNPRMTVSDTLMEAVRQRRRVTSQEALAQSAALLEKVGVAPAHIRKYPHEFSGGQRQRIAIARALAVEPKLIVADEPVSALDVSVQSQIINLLLDLCRQMSLTLVFISHDLSAVRYAADRVAVMYLGRVVELGEAETLIETPLHPYTKALVSAIPKPDPDEERKRRRVILEGDPPSPLYPPRGCAFHPRCRYMKKECKRKPPPLEEYGILIRDYLRSAWDGMHSEETLKRHTTSQKVACIRAREIKELPFEL